MPSPFPIPAALSALAIVAPAAAAQTFDRTFTYQGRLDDGGSPANGLFDLSFGFFGDPTGGTVFTTDQVSGVEFTDGYFLVDIAPGDPRFFDGRPIFMEIGIRPNDPSNTAPFTVFPDRTPIFPTPYALFALDAPAVSWNGLTDVPAGFADNVDNDTVYGGKSPVVISGGTISLDPAPLDTSYINAGEAAGGDLAGTFPSPIVDGLRGRPVSSSAPQPGQVLLWNSSSWAPTYITDSDTTYSAGTGLSLSATTFSLNLSYTDPRYINSGEAAGGDLAGSFPSPTVDGLRGRPVSATAPGIGQVLGWTGSQWQPLTFNDTNTTYSAGEGLVLSGTTFSVGPTLNVAGTRSVFPTLDYRVLAGDDLDIDVGDDIFMDSPSNIRITASNRLDLDGLSEVQIDAGTTDINGQTEIDLTAPTLDLNAIANLSMTSGGGALLSGSATTISGGSISLSGPTSTTGNFTVGGLAQVNTNLNVLGGAFKPGGGLWGVLSDERLKQNVEPLTGSLDLINALEPVSFEYKDPSHWAYAPGRFDGFIAQQVQHVNPRWVEPTADGMLAVTPQGLEAHLVAAIQSLTEQLEDERARNESLEARLARLEAALLAD